MAVEIIGIPNHRFIQLLEKVVHNQANIENARRVEFWRGMGEHKELPEDLAFAMKPSSPPANVKQILDATYIPTEGNLERITQDFGMPPDEKRTQRFLELGREYIRDCNAHREPEVSAVAVASSEQTSAAETLGQALRAARESRHQRPTDMAIVSLESTGLPKNRFNWVDVGTVAHAAGIGAAGWLNIEQDKTRLTRNHWPLLEKGLIFLDIDEDRIAGIRNLFDVRLKAQQEASKGRKGARKAAAGESTARG